MYKTLQYVNFRFKGFKMKKLFSLLLIWEATSLFADGAALYSKCVSCHGAKGEKAALGKSAIIKGQSAAKLEASLKGYKDGTYGGAQKVLMKGQVNLLNDTQIKEVADYISKL